MKEINNSIYVVGHKNPDTDSICSAIGYANLKAQITGQDVQPMRAGVVSDETQFILDTFKVEAPQLLEHVFTQVKDLDINVVEGVNNTTTLKEAWAKMKTEGLKTLPVTEGRKLIGVVSTSDVANSCMNAAVLDADNSLNVVNTTTVDTIMTKENLLVFSLEDCVNEISEIMASKRHRDFPVVDSEGNFVGFISRRRLMGGHKKQLILVDHNEVSQAVDGIQEADLLEIIDHHKISVDTAAPIFFRNQPVGCTGTIVTQMYKESGVEITREIAGLLCSAILSDTLMFRSPTCTPVDKKTAEELAVIAGIEIESYANDMFRAGSNLSNKTPKEICYQDFKMFEAAGIKYGVGQVNFMSNQDIDENKNTIQEYMPTVIKDQGADMVFYMLTNILDESSTMLYDGEGSREALVKAFELDEDDTDVRLEGVVSRKKQVIPAFTNSFNG